MTHTTPPRPPGPGRPAATDRAHRDHDWHATTGEAIARIDNALTAISARVDAIGDENTRGHAIGVLAAVLPALEQLAERLTDPAAGDHRPPY